MAKTLHSLKDLKGLIPKDEPVRPAVKAKHSEKPAEPVKVNSDPKVGDMVVLMESDEHGKIQRIDKKTYYVRLDDGMVVSLGKWDFAVTDEKEEERLRNAILARRRPAASEEQPSPATQIMVRSLLTFILRRWLAAVPCSRDKPFSSRLMPSRPRSRNVCLTVG